MRVIIPAAGLGQRLSPHTDDRPKCLVPVAGVPILDRLLGQLLQLGVSEVICVSGHHADVLERHVNQLTARPPVTFLHNPHYAASNSIVSLAMTRAYWTEEFAVVDSDVLVSTALLRSLLTGHGDAMVIDTQRPPEAVDMAVELRDGAVWHLDKVMDRHLIGGEFFGLARWSVPGAQQLDAVLQDMLAADETDVWYQYAIRRVAKNLKIETLPAGVDEWTEVDTPVDLAAAESAHARGAAWTK